MARTARTGWQACILAALAWQLGVPQAGRLLATASNRALPNLRFSADQGQREDEIGGGPACRRDWPLRWTLADCPERSKESRTTCDEATSSSDGGRGAVAGLLPKDEGRVPEREAQVPAEQRAHRERADRSGGSYVCCKSGCYPGSPRSGGLHRPRSGWPRSNPGRQCGADVLCLGRRGGSRLGWCSTSRHGCYNVGDPSKAHSTGPTNSTAGSGFDDRGAACPGRARLHDYVGGCSRCSERSIPAGEPGHHSSRSKRQPYRWLRWGRTCTNRPGRTKERQYTAYRTKGYGQAQSANFGGSSTGKHQGCQQGSCPCGSLSQPRTGRKVGAEAAICEGTLCLRADSCGQTNRRQWSHSIGEHCPGRRRGRRCIDDGSRARSRRSSVVTVLKGLLDEGIPASAFDRLQRPESLAPWGKEPRFEFFCGQCHLSTAWVSEAQESFPVSDRERCVQCFREFLYIAHQACSCPSQVDFSVPSITPQWTFFFPVLQRVHWSLAPFPSFCPASTQIHLFKSVQGNNLRVSPASSALADTCSAFPFLHLQHWALKRRIGSSGSSASVPQTGLAQASSWPNSSLNVL